MLSTILRTSSGNSETAFSTQGRLVTLKVFISRSTSAAGSTGVVGVPDSTVAAAVVAELDATVATGVVGELDAAAAAGA
jgi:hypothetical protein